MKQDICTIPISEVFENSDGCPICAIRKEIELRLIDFIVGDAMMEPSVRVETNRKGFCERHLLQIASQQKRLPIALMLDTHLEYIQNNMLTKGKKYKKSMQQAAREAADSCFICEYLEDSYRHSLETLVLMYANENDFRKIFKEREYICMEHYADLLDAAEKHLKCRDKKEFISVCSDIVGKQCAEMRKNLEVFIDAFDYRTTEKVTSEDSKKSIEKIVDFLIAKF